MAAPVVIVYANDGNSIQTLQTFVRDVCRQYRLPTPLLPLEDIPSYRLYRSACEGTLLLEHILQLQKFTDQYVLHSCFT